MLRFCKTLIAFPVAFLILLSSALAQTTAKPDLSKQPTIYVVGYAHLDTEWRWEYPQVIDEYIRKTMEDNFKLFDKYPHYVFNFSGANRYRFMKEYFPADFAKLKKYVDEGRWFPAGSSMEEGDVNAPSAEAIIRQVLYGNDWFRKELGRASAEYMLPDCFGFPASLPTILAHSGVKGFSTQKLVWGSSANAGGSESAEKTPEGTPFDVGVWVGPDGESVLAGLNPGSYGGGIFTDLSKPLPPAPPSAAAQDVQNKIQALRPKLEQAQRSGKAPDPKDIEEFVSLRNQQEALARIERDRNQERYQSDWAARVELNGKVSGVYTDYHYYGTGDIGGAPNEDSVKRLEAIVTQATTSLPAREGFFFRGERNEGPPVKVGDGPVHVISANAEQMFLDITPSQAAGLPRYTGEMELTNHSAGSLTSQAYQKRWIRKEELLADAAEKASIAAEWLGARPYPLQRLNDAWTLAMGAHFHDIAAGTATPRSYEFAWNDDVIAMNQFAGVLNNATEAVAAALNTETKGVPLVVFNPLNIVREDLVEASVSFHGGMPKAVRVIGPDGKDVPAQISNGKVIFVAKVPSVGYAVYDVQPGASAADTAATLQVSENSLENQYYRVKLNADGDVASIFDKSTGRELLAAPARLAISYDNPHEWPAWNMDWDQEQAAPKAYVIGPAKIRVVENGPARVAVEVSRETAGSRFVQTIRLSAGDAGKRVEFGNAIDWNTKESNLKASFPLTASNQMATYNWDIGTIERPTAQPKKFEVPSHQWIDLTDMSGEFGATILTDCKNGSDKPNDHTIRLTLIRTPATRGGYADQGTQDIGHHEFVYGIAGHAADWRHGQTDWQAQRLNDPLIAFESPKHAGALGRESSLLKVSDSRIRVLALKKAEQGDEIIVRLVELDGKPQPNVRISFPTPITTAREVNGQEQAVGTATVTDGALVTSFSAYQPRTFAVRFAAPQVKVAAVRSAPVALRYDLATASNDGTHSASGFDSEGNALPAEMMPAQITFNDVQFQLAPAKSGSPNAVVAKGQTIELPVGRFNRVYVLAASAEGDQEAMFKVGTTRVDLNIQDWGGFIGQWDDRQWSSGDTSSDNYGKMIGLTRAYIKRADLAWYCSHHHNAAGENIPYGYSYLFAYPIDLATGTRTITLPDNDNIRVLALSVANENPEVKPAQPLYDLLAPPPAGADDFALRTRVDSISVPKGRSGTTTVTVTRRGNFRGSVSLNVSGLPSGVTVSFSPASTARTSKMTLTADNSSKLASSTITITGTSGGLSHTVTTALTVAAIKKGTVAVDLSSAYNTKGIYTDGSEFAPAASADGEGFAYSKETLGATQLWDGVLFNLGPANAPDAVTGRTVALAEGKFGSLNLLATGVEGGQESQVFTITYADGTSASVTQSLSDWYESSGYKGESEAVVVPYHLVGDGSKDNRTFYLYGYSFNLDSNKVVRSITLPDNERVLVFAMTLIPPAGPST
ncbi:MAG: glycoside hydrolase family 38 C-terminal domain-containing protein [Candidatus Sulfotelmatobacter sp.]|jgi:alpha-mannosidase